MKSLEDLKKMREKALKKVIKEDNEYISRIDEFITG